MKNLAKFTQTTVLTPGKTYFQSASTGVCGYIKSPEWVDREIGLYNDIDTLNGLIHAVTNPNISVTQDAYILIEGEDIVSKIRTCDPSLCGSVDKIRELFETTNEDNGCALVAEGTIGAGVINSLKKAQDLTRATTVEYDDKIHLRTEDYDKLVISNANPFFQGLGRFVSSAEFLSIPATNYNFKVFHIKARNRVRLLLESEELTVMVSLVGQ